jgi:hypothetical protein
MRAEQKAYEGPPACFRAVLLTRNAPLVALPFAPSIGRN